METEASESSLVLCSRRQAGREAPGVLHNHKALCNKQPPVSVMKYGSVINVCNFLSFKYVKRFSCLYSCSIMETQAFCIFD